VEVMAGSIFFRTAVATCLAVVALAVLGKARADDDLAAQQKAIDVHLAAHRYAEAATIARQLVLTAESSSSDPRVIGGSCNRLGHVYRAWGRYADAEASYRKALDLYERTFGPSHILTALTVNNVAEVYRLQKRYDEGASLYTRAEKIAAQLPPSVDSALILASFSLCRQEQGDDAEAERLFRRTLAFHKSPDGDRPRPR
jgi:tetratricopeptide (TPR) repeat protein